MVYPGRHTFDHGPDFRDALLVFGTELQRGDVEVHVRAGDWRSHGHQQNPAYNRVALHVVWRDDGPPALTASGRIVPVLVLEQWVDQAVEGDETVGVPEESMECGWPCAKRPSLDTLALLAGMGEERLAVKAAVFEASLAVAAPAQVLYAGLLEALGYAANRGACRQLAELVPWPVVAAAAVGLPLDERVTTLEALLLGAAGLLPAQRETPRPLAPADLAYAEGLARRWSGLDALWRITPLERRAWRFARVRPENFPPRRLAAAARLFAPDVGSDLSTAFLGVLRSEQPDDLPAALESALTVPASGYWATHCDFGGRPTAPTQLLGRGRAAEVAINVAIPFAIASGEAFAEPLLAARARAAFRRYPSLADNELTRYQARLLFGRARPRGVLAGQQQGLLHAYHRFCREKCCGECPLNPRPGFLQS